MLLLLKVFSAGLVPRCRGEWPNCGHSLVVTAGLPGAGVPTAPAGAAMTATPNGATSATMPARVVNLDVGRISPPAGAGVDDPRRYRTPPPPVARYRQRRSAGRRESVPW